MRRSVNMLAAAAVLGASTLAAVPAQADPMAVPESAGVYLAYMCPANTSVARFGRTADKYDKHDGPGDKINKRTRTAARRAAMASYGLWIGFTAREWPAPVAGDIAALAEGYRVYAANLYTIAGSTRWPDVEFADLGTYSTPARAGLGLPARGKGC